MKEGIGSCGLCTAVYMGFILLDLGIANNNCHLLGICHMPGTVPKTDYFTQFQDIFMRFQCCFQSFTDEES